MTTATPTATRPAPLAGARAGSARLPMAWAVVGSLVVVGLAVAASLLLGVQDLAPAAVLDAHRAERQDREGLPLREEVLLQPLLVRLEGELQSGGPVEPRQLQPQSRVGKVAEEERGHRRAERKVQIRTTAETTTGMRTVGRILFFLSHFHFPTLCLS